MVDLSTYFFYIGLLFFLVTITYQPSKKTWDNLNLSLSTSLDIKEIFALFVVSFFVGFRYYVGVDWEQYTENFRNFVLFPNFSFGDQYHEFGFFLINKLVAAAGGTYQLMFLIIAYISWFFVFKSVPKILLPLLILFLFLDEYFFWSMNGVRQFASMSIWLCAIKYIINRDFKKYVIYIATASLFHVSVILLVPIYFLPFYRLHKSSIWILLYLATLVLGSSTGMVEVAKSSMEFLGNSIEILQTYNRYADSGLFEINNEINVGLGYLFKIAVNLILIIISGKIISMNQSSKVYFTLFFIGTLVYNLSYNIQVLSRINQYFLIVKPVVLSISAFYLFQLKGYRVFVVLLCLLYFFIFLSAIYNSSNMSAPFRLQF